MENATVETQNPKIEETISAEEAKQDVYSARYHVEMTVDADSATDEEWAAAYKAADHSATFATYDEAVNFVREGKAKFGEAFEGGHVNRNGGIVKQIHATSPTLEQMGAEVANILQEIDYAKSRGNNVGARELERKLGRTRQDFYYSIVHFGVEVSNEQFEFAFKREIVKHKARRELARRNSDEYKASVKAEAEYDAKQARAIIEANASVDGIEYVAGVKKLLDSAILAGRSGDIVYHAGELKRCLGKMTAQPAAKETTTVITDAELVVKAAVPVNVASTSEKAVDEDEMELRYIPCRGFSVNGKMFASLKGGIENWLSYIVCEGGCAELLIATRKQLANFDGKPVRGKYRVDRVIAKYNGRANKIWGLVKGDSYGVGINPGEEYFDPEYETQCKKIITDWLDKNAKAYRKYQLRVEAKRRADKYYTEIPDWYHNHNMVPNSQREAIREYLEQLHASDETATANKKESDAVDAAEINNQTDISTITAEIPATSIDSDSIITTLGGLLVTTLTALYNVTTAKPATEPAITTAESADNSVDNETPATGSPTFAIQQDAPPKGVTDGTHEAPASTPVIVEDAAEISETRKLLKQAKHSRAIFNARIIGCKAELQALEGVFEAELEMGAELEELIQTAKEIGACLERRDFQQRLMDDCDEQIANHEQVIAEYYGMK